MPRPSRAIQLLGENGSWALILLAVPFAATLLVALALLTRRRSALWIDCAITGVPVLETWLRG